MIYLRSLFANIFFYTTIAIGCALCPIVAIFPQKYTLLYWDKVVMPLGLFFVKIFAGLKLEFRGKQHIANEPVIYASKHESALETYAFTQIIPSLSYVLKKELTYIPLFGWAQYFYGMIPVDRNGGASAMKNMLKEVKKRVQKNRPVVIFPEGTRCKPGTTKGYKSGFLFVAENLKIKVVPVAINTGLFWAKSSFLRYPGTAVFEFMEPMEITKDTDKKEFMKELEARIEAKCIELNNEAIEKYPWVKNNLG